MGLCNPLKNPERYLELGMVSRRVSDFGRNARESKPYNQSVLSTVVYYITKVDKM